MKKMRYARIFVGEAPRVRECDLFSCAFTLKLLVNNLRAHKPLHMVVVILKYVIIY